MTWRGQKIGLGITVVSLLVLGAACDSSSTNDTSTRGSIAPAFVESIAPNPVVANKVVTTNTSKVVTKTTAVNVNKAVNKNVTVANLNKTVVAPAPQPTSEPYVQPEQSTTPAPKTESKYLCDCSKTCPEITSCDEAYFQLNTCGCSIRDGDHDGVPCENICPGG